MTNTEENRELLRRVFDEMADGNPRALSEAMADDFRWVFPGDWSWSGVWEPREVALTGLLRPLMAQFDDDGYRLSADYVLADGDRVVVQARGHGTTRHGKAYHQTYCFVFRVRNGRLTEVIEHCDTALVERALERPS